MNASMTKRSTSIARVFAYAMFISAVTLFFCSKSSFGYPINDWTDANIYFTIGKGMTHGQVVYRDLYDHKGPLLYMLHALCALISPMSFTGVYVLEIICSAAFLTIAFQLMTIYGAKGSRYFALPLISFVIFTSTSFEQGDSAEELCLCLLVFSLYDILRYLKTEYPHRMSAKHLIINGVVFGAVFWIKFTMVGLFAGFLLTLFLLHGAKGEWKHAFSSVGWFLLGFVISTLPWLLYFGINDALLPWVKTYLYDNLFLYSSSGESAGLVMRLKDIAKSALSWGLENLRYTLLIAIGLGFGIFHKSASKWQRISLLLMFLIGALGVFIGGKSYPYYGLILAAFVPLGMIPLCLLADRCIQRLPKARRFLPALCCICCALCFALSYQLSPNVKTSFGQDKSTTMQYQFAAILSEYENPTLLNYGFMDAGFYTASGITPDVKYFHQTNVPLEEMMQEQIRYIEGGVCDFIVTRGKQPESIHNLYELIAAADAPDHFWYDHVYLYKLKTLASP